MTTSQEYAERFEHFVPQPELLRFSEDHLPHASSVNGGVSAPDETPPSQPPPAAPGGPATRPEPSQLPAQEPGDPGPQPPQGEPVAAAAWPLKHVGPDMLPGVPFEEQKALDDYLQSRTDVFRQDVAAIKEAGAHAVLMAQRGIRFEAACKALLAGYAGMFSQMSKALSYLLPGDLEDKADVRQELADVIADAERALHAPQPPLAS